MITHTRHRLAAFAASAAISASLFSSVAGSMPLAALDVRPHIALPTVTVVASRAQPGQATAQAAPSVACANS